MVIHERKQGEFVMFCRDRDPAKETWDGRRYGIEGAVEHFDADDAYPIDDLEEILPGLMEDRESVYYSIGLNPAFDKHILKCMNDLRAQSRRGARAHARRAPVCARSHPSPPAYASLSA